MVPRPEPTLNFVWTIGPLHGKHALVSQVQLDPAKANAFHAFLERRECSQVFILCCGQAGMLMMHPLQFVTLSRISDRNLLMIRDVNSGCYQRGVSDQIGDIPGVVEWLRQRLAALPQVKSVYCVGSSGGAYMAMIAGHLLRADAVWAFAPPVVVTVGGKHGLEYVDPRFADLSQVLAESNGVTRYHVYYNESHAPDRESCSRLRDTPGVQLFPEGGEGHPVVLHLVRTKRLGTLFPPLQRG